MGEPMRLPATTTLYYSDGTVMARLGQVRRSPVPLVEMVEPVAQVAVAAEDPDFWTNSIGPITRSVVRQMADIRSDTTSARLRVTALAIKLDDELSKDEILEYHLNAIPFGRSSYGIEAAAAAYFGRTTRRSAPSELQLTMAEAMVLLALVDQPSPDPNDPTGSPGFDPANGAKAHENSVRRWGEIRDALVDADVLTATQAGALTYPDAVAPATVTGLASDVDRPTGLVVNHVLDELTHTKGSPFEGQAWQSIEEGGFDIHTTLNPGAQKATEAAADGTVAGSVMAGQPQNLQAAAVMVEPGTGRVLAYFGGADGRGNDYASFYYDELGEAVGVGRYPAGGSFMAYTLAAALHAGISLKSNWQWAQHPQDGRPASNPIRNASTCTTGPRDGVCSLLDATSLTLNVAMYVVTLSVSPVAVLTMARNAGIDYLWSDDMMRQDLRTVNDMGTLVPAKFDTVLGIGQYAVTVLDQANAMATFAGGGVRATAHFVTKVVKGDQILYAERLPNPTQPKVLSPQAAADLSYALSQNPSGRIDGADSATKTGNWQFNQLADQNAHAWVTGYTSSAALAVHIGNRREDQPLIDKQGATIWGSGLPSAIYRSVMTSVVTSQPPRPFAPPAFAGRLDPPLSVP